MSSTYSKTFPGFIVWFLSHLKKNPTLREIWKNAHVSFWKSLPNFQNFFNLLPLSQIKGNFADKPLWRWAFNWYDFCSGGIRLWSVRKHLTWPICAKSSERLRARPWQTGLLFPPKLNQKAQWKYNSCSCCWVVLFTCLTIFIPFVIKVSFKVIP